MEFKRLEASAELRKEKEINLKVIFNIVKKRLWLIVLLTTLFTVIAGVYQSRPEPQMYVSSTRIIIAAHNDMMNTVRVMVREPIVLNKVIDELGIKRSAAQLRSQIKVESVEASLVTVISVVDTDPNRAADIANSVVKAYRQVASDTLNVQSIRLLTPAEPEPYPINVKSNTILYVGFIVGLLLSLGITFFLDSLDDSIRTEDELEQLLGLNMLGQVSKMKRKHTVVSSKKPKPGLIRSETIGS